jgi:hypothetical protein
MNNNTMTTNKKVTPPPPISRHRFISITALAFSLILTFAFVLASCGDSGGGGGTSAVESYSQAVTYSGEGGGSTYTLLIAEGGEGRYAAQAGDTYELTVGTKVSAGTVNSAAGGVLTLKPYNSATTFTATVDDSGITAMGGSKITFQDNSQQDPPASFTAKGKTDSTVNTSPKTLVITGAGSDTIYGYGTIQIRKGGFGIASNDYNNKPEFYRSGDKITVKLRKIEGNGSLGSLWTGSGTYDISFYLMLSSSTPTAQFMAYDIDFNAAVITVPFSQFKKIN